MSLIVGIEPERSIKNQLHNAATQIVRMIETQGVPVNFIDPNTYHIELFSIRTKRISPKWLYQKMILKNFSVRKFDLSISRIKLGTSSRLREFVYLQVDDGSDILREIVYDLGNRMGVKRSRNFTPGICIARIPKDLSDQEIHNLQSSIHEYDQVNMYSVKFEFPGISIMEKKNDQLVEVKKFAT